MSGAQPRSVNVGLCGAGTVGQSVLKLLAGGSSESIAARAGCEVNITHIGMRTPRPDVDTSGMRLSQDVMAVVEDPDVAILIEAIGGEQAAKELVLKAIAAGKHVVTANKALLALHGEEIMAAARAAGVLVRFEAAVAAGIPIIKAISEGLAANRIRRIKGIINGTTNYILSALENGDQTMAEALRLAQVAGYAEEDPTYDIDGIDSAHKLTILASLALAMPLAFKHVYIEGISDITAADIAQADEYGYRIKHLAVAAATDAGFELRVHPAMVPLTNPLASVSGSTNAIAVLGDATGTTLYCGAGAGGAATASAILADVADILRDTAAPGQAQARSQISLFPEYSNFSGTILDIGAIRSRHYLRMNIKDEPGVLSAVTKTLSGEAIDVEQVKQGDTNLKSEHTSGATNWKSLALITHEIEGASIMRALAALRGLDSVNDDIRHIRIEDDD